MKTNIQEAATKLQKNSGDGTVMNNVPPLNPHSSSFNKVICNRKENS